MGHANQEHAGYEVSERSDFDVMTCRQASARVRHDGADSSVVINAFA